MTVQLHGVHQPIWWGVCQCMLTCVYVSVEHHWIIHEVVKMTSRQRESSFTSISHSVSSSLSQPYIIDEKQGATWLSQQHSNRANPLGMVTREQITSNCWPNHVTNTTGPLRVAGLAYTKKPSKLLSFLVRNMRLLTMPWCAVMQHFNLISLNNFLGYDALSFDYQGCFIILFYLWEIWIPVFNFHFSWAHCFCNVKTGFLNECIYGRTGCVLYNAPCMDQSIMWKLQYGSALMPSHGRTE